MPKLISLPNLFSKSWSLYRSRFSYFASLLAVPYSIFFLNFILAQFTFLTPIALLLSVVGFVLLVLVSISILLSFEADELPEFKKSWQLAWPYFWQLIFVSVITGLIVVGGTFLFLIPGFIFAFYLNFAKTIAVLENKKGLDALSRSWSYVRGYFWSVTGRMLLLMAIAVLASMLVGSVSNIFGQFIGTFINFLWQIILTPFMFAYAYCLYKDLREIKTSEVGDNDGRSSVILAGWFALAGWLVLIASIVLFFLFLGTSVGDLLTNIILSNSLNI